MLGEVLLACKAMHLCAYVCACGCVFVCDVVVCVVQPIQESMLTRAPLTGSNVQNAHSYC